MLNKEIDNVASKARVLMDEDITLEEYINKIVEEKIKENNKKISKKIKEIE
ncbi:MAG: hypothetical protein KHZ99_18735 [Clostridium sp.]|uniref:hypothetical protein n=1 Tax=Clostridium sp. TaxID=1506 RepID=UPI0025BBDF78|nr:hypothetical protein [Clostridium sp.]MBS4959037.1 hypothetical protein [Clostridium sp.]